MLNKTSKPAYLRYLKSTAKVLFFVEAAAFVSSYGLWYKLNTDRDFRFYMHRSFYPVLDWYYKIGETISSSELKIRQADLDIWQKEGKLT